MKDFTLSIEFTDGDFDLTTVRAETIEEPLPGVDTETPSGPLRGKKGKEEKEEKEDADK